MLLNKEIRKIDKEIKRTENHSTNEDEVVINIKASSDEQIFSSYNYDNKTSISSELSTYLWDNAKLAPFYKSIKLQIYCKEHIEKDEVEKAIKSHYRREYTEVKDELSKKRGLSFICLLLGIFSLATLVILNSLSVNYILTSIIDIIAWVFVWEAVDIFCLESMGLKQKCRILMRLYTAKIIIITNETTNNINNNLLGEINED